MPRARAQVRPGRARKIVNYSWAGIQTGPTTVPFGTKVLLATFVLSTEFDETHVRVRGVISVTSDAAVVVEPQIGAWGIIRVSETAIAIGVTAIPSPVFNASDDGWVAWAPIAQQSSFSTGAGAQGMVIDVDSKAQRIIRDGQALAVVVENSAAATGLSIIMQIRELARFRS